jgi:hypothetical protein
MTVHYILRSVMTAMCPQLLITLDFTNAFLFPGVNSRAELLPSPQAYARNGTPRRWLRDKKSRGNETSWKL